MAESKSSLLARSVQKHAGRAKEKFLQNLGKVDRTADGIFEEYMTNFNRQQSNANRLQKEFNNYIRCIRAVQNASKSLMEAVSEVYESDWTGADALNAQMSAIDVLWQDFSHKLGDQVLIPLNTYTAQFPDMKKKIEKRNRKLLDYDSQRHSFESLQASSAKRKDDVKVTKGREQLEEARRTFEIMNSELYDELPALYDSRILFLVTNLQTLFASEQVFHHETNKIYGELEAIVDKLATESQRGSYSLKKTNGNARSNVSSPPQSPLKAMANSTNSLNSGVTPMTNGNSHMNSPPQTVMGIDSQQPSEHATPSSTLAETAPQNNPIKPTPAIHDVPITITTSQSHVVSLGAEPAPIGSDCATADTPLDELPGGETATVVAMIHPQPPPTPIDVVVAQSYPVGAVVIETVQLVVDNEAASSSLSATPEVELKQEVIDSPAVVPGVPISSSIAAPTTTTTTGTFAINTTITRTNPIILPVVVPLDSNHELETSLSTVSASTSTPSSSPVAVNKATAAAADSANNNHSSEPSYQNTEQVAIAAGGVPSSPAATVPEVTSKVEENNNRTSMDKGVITNGHSGASQAAEEVDGVPKSPRHNNKAAPGESASAANAAAQPDSTTMGAVAKEGNDFSHLQRLYNNLYDNQEMVVRMMTANLGRPDNDFDDQEAMSILMRPPLQQQFMYDIPVSPPAGITKSDLPPGTLYRVQATYRYDKEDADELSFEIGETINVIEYDDPEDQEEGWLMGHKENTGEKGLFPANFTRPL